jgi:YD repeat-containing protein
MRGPTSSGTLQAPPAVTSGVISVGRAPRVLTCTDVGADSPAGSVSGWAITGGGPGINDTVTSHPSGAEGFAFAEASEPGDFSLRGGSAGQTSTGSSKYYSNGIMLRAGLGTPASYYYVYVISGSGSTVAGTVYVDYLATSAGTPVNLATLPLSGQALPGPTGLANTCQGGSTGGCYLAIERRTDPTGSTKFLEAFWGKDSTHLQAISGSTVTLHSTDALYSAGNAGVAVTSDSSGYGSTATFSGVTLSSSALGDEIPEGAECAPGYQCALVGSFAGHQQWAISGNAWASSPWTISGAGTGLVSGATSDQLQWDYSPLNSDGSVSAQIGGGYEFYVPTGLYGVSQYGVALRGSNAANAPFFAAFVSPCGGINTAYRTTAGGAATVSNDSGTDCTQSGNEYHGLSPTSSIQLMVKRTRTSYQGYQSSGNGVWTAYGSSVTITTIPSQAPAGPFATSTISGWQAWANFSYVTISGDQPASQELLGGGGSLEVPSNGFSGPGNAFTGNFVQSHSDLSISGRGLPLGVSRVYNSLLGSQPAPSISPYGNLGPGWSASENTFTTADTAGNVTVHQGDGSAVTFAYNGSVYTPPVRVLATLVVNTSQTLAPNCPATSLVLTTHAQVRLAYYKIQASPPAGQPSGALCELLDRNGYPTLLTYNSANTQLTTVTECTTVSGTACGTNRTFTVAYANGSYPNSITSVTSSANAGTGTLKATFTYNASGYLATSADADGNTTYYSYNTEGFLNSIQTPKEHAASAAGLLIWYDTSGRARYTQDPAAKAAGLGSITSYAYACCSTDGTQTTTTVDANAHQTNDVFAAGMMTSQTMGVGTPQAATWNYTFDQNTLGIHTVTEPGNGSSVANPVSYTDWYPTGTQYGNVQCTATPDHNSGWDVTSYTYNSYNEVLTKTSPLQQSTSSDGSCTTTPSGYQTTNTYGNGNGNLTQMVQVLNSGGSTATTTYSYGQNGDTKRRRRHQHPGSQPPQ